jgi:hypothetical protein
MMTRKQGVVLGTVAIVFAILLFFTFCPPGAKAAEKPIPFLAPTIGYQDAPTIGVGAGALFPSNGMLFLGTFTYQQTTGGGTGIVPFNACGAWSDYVNSTYCRHSFQVPYPIPESGGLGFMFTVAFPLDGKKWRRIIDDDPEPFHGGKKP